MKELYDLLPNIILYLVIRFIFLKTYRFVLIAQATTNVKSHITFYDLISRKRQKFKSNRKTNNKNRSLLILIKRQTSIFIYFELYTNA